MSKDFDPFIHSCVGVRSRGIGPRPIILHVGKRVWIPGHHTDLSVGADVIQVGDGVTTGFDAEGDCIISVPTALCEFWTPDEAEAIIKMIEADATTMGELH